MKASLWFLTVAGILVGFTLVTEMLINIAIKAVTQIRNTYKNRIDQ